MELEFLEPVPEENISHAQRKFANGVKLDPMHRGTPLTSKPGRKIFFQENVSISKFIQKTAVHFRVKGTDYVLELARFEEFKKSITGHTRWTPLTVRWGASMVNPMWKRILSDRALRNADDLGFDTFFPKGKGDGRSDCSFEKFLKVVKVISEMLSPLPRSGETPLGDDDEVNSTGVLGAELGTLF